MAATLSRHVGVANVDLSLLRGAAIESIRPTVTIWLG